MPLSPGGIVPRDMNARQWSEFVSQSGIQAAGRARTFTPTWLGFSSDPSGDLSYWDFGQIVFIWTDVVLTGTSNDASMQITNLPEQLQPSGIERWANCFVVDSATQYRGAVRIFGKDDALAGRMVFYMDLLSGGTKIAQSSSGFTAAGAKGLAAGCMIGYPK